MKISKNVCGFFSRTLALIFTYVFLKKFSRTYFCFHGQVFRNFHGREKKITHGKPKIVYNFHGRDFDFHGGKNAAHPSFPVIQGKNNKQHFLKISHIISLKVEKILDKLDLKKNIDQISSYYRVLF